MILLMIVALLVCLLWFWRHVQQRRYFTRFHRTMQVATQYFLGLAMILWIILYYQRLN